MTNSLRDAFSRLSAIGKAMVLARLIHAETVYTRDAYTADYDAPDGLRLRKYNETVHRLSGVLMAVLGETHVSRSSRLHGRNDRADRLSLATPT